MLDEMRKHDVESNHVFLLTDAVQLFSLLEQGATSVSAAIHYEVTCVSSRHSRKCVTLLNLMTELIFFFLVLEHQFLKKLILRTLNCHPT